jgi:large subunit ribosomal protein L28
MRACELTGKKSIKGHAVSHSNHKTLRRFNPNLQTKRFFVPETGKWITLRVSTSAMRTINKKGLYEYIKELGREGKAKISL